MRMKSKTLSATIIAAVITIIAAVALFMMPSMQVHAAGETWRNPGDGCYYLEGTNIVIQRDGEVLRVKGTGAIPDYDYWTRSERPWKTSGCTTLIVDSTITYLGSYSFADLSKLQNIQIHSTTFIADTTVFSAIAYKPVFRIYDSGVTTEMIGTIPYTSLDSIKTIAQSNSNGACYIMDTPAAVREFQNSTNPTIPNVFYSGDANHPWTELEDNGNGNVVTVFCKLSDKNPSYTMGVTGQRRYQGRACLQAYAAFIEDYQFATCMNLTVLNAGKKVEQTEQPLEYVITIPNEFRMAGRSFRMLGIGAGTVYIYDDVDSSDATITIRTDKPSTAYALVYK